MSNIIKIFGYNCEEAAEYIENDIADSPYHTFAVTRDFYGTSAKYPSSMAEADSLPNVLEFDQVLFNTSVRSMHIHHNYVFKSDNMGHAAESHSPITKLYKLSKSLNTKCKI